MSANGVTVTSIRPAGNAVQRAIRAVLGPLAGEMSNLRARLSAIAGGGLYDAYTLSSSKVDYALARQLYRNTHDGYKLGAAFAKPIVNTTAAFVGTPKWKHANEDVQAELNTFTRRYEGTFLDVNRNTVRDGDCYVRLVTEPDRFNPSDDPGNDQLCFRLVPPEWVTPEWDPLDRSRWLSVSIKHPVKVVIETAGGTRTNPLRREEDHWLLEKITPTEITVSADETAPPELKERNGTFPNPFGFIPIVHFKNEAEESELFGASDLESVEPFLKAYHDVMLHAAQGSRLFSRPKVKFKLSNVQTFLTNNFSAAEIAAGRVNFKDKELFLLGGDDDAEFISSSYGMDGIAQLLELLYFCIVDVSEMPEFVFGVAIQSSKGSVAEQQIPLARKIQRKRGQLAPFYAELGEMYVAAWAKRQNIAFRDKFAVTVDWDELSQKDEVNTATAIRTTVEGLAMALSQGIMAPESASEHLRTLIQTMKPWKSRGQEDGEEDRIKAALPFLKQIAEAVTPPVRSQGRPPGPNSTARTAAGTAA